MSPSKLSPESDVFSKSPNRLRGVNKLTAVLAIGLGVAGLTACANAEGPKPTPTETSVVETEPPVPAPEMKTYILTPDQLDVFNNYTGDGDLNQFAHVIGETIIPATQAYLDNLMLNKDNMDSVATSSITDNPDSRIISELKLLVKLQGSNPELDAKFFVCSTERETNPAICNAPGRQSSWIVNGVVEADTANRLSIVRITGKDPFGGNEDSNISIFIGDGQVVKLTGSNQIVYK
ncbi:MAG TPA: hypothetical protein PK265_01070 [Candidatus Saccharibacteria bacterium]|nr:hypothetical protein [Candidatus Saccharibacteria bacterium]HRQ97903.1 hypothetical protein [Candidatus Saccharibacteria bacterium]